MKFFTQVRVKHKLSINIQTNIRRKTVNNLTINSYIFYVKIYKILTKIECIRFKMLH